MVTLPLFNTWLASDLNDRMGKPLFQQQPSNPAFSERELFWNFNSPSSEQKCPLCRSLFQVPSGNEEKGLKDLPQLFFTLNILEQGNQEDLDPHNLICNFCEETDATTFCSNCNLFSCHRCQKVHKRAPATSNHIYLSLDDGYEKKKVSRVNQCPIHPNQEINTFCENDKSVICLQCAIESHSGHRFKKMDEIVVSFADQIKPKLNKVHFHFFTHLISSLFLSLIFFKFLSLISTKKQKTKKNEKKDQREER